MSKPFTAKQILADFYVDMIRTKTADELNTIIKGYEATLNAWRDEAVKRAGGEVSDGYHTFNELYAHRIALFIALAVTHSHIAWRSMKHDDGSEYEGWFIAGMHLPTGDISYHLPESDWDKLTGYVETLPKAPKWDGHTAADVVKRLNEWVANYE